MIDVDLFKRVNDSFGHMAGDRMLTRVADKIMGVVGCSGIVGRLGGDEFAVLFTDASDQRTIFQRIKAIIAAVEAASPPIEGASPATVTIGYAFMPDDAETADDLMRAADVALYRGKRGGRAVAIPFQETGATG